MATASSRRQPEVNRERFDVAVVGGGAAGMWTAIQAAEAGASVCLISRKPLAESASFRAQGGLAAALEPGDSPEQHAVDTLAAGRGLCDPETVRVLTVEAPGAVDELLRRGFGFDRTESGQLALGLEGGHTRRRIIHAGGSQTGRELTGRLARIAASTPRLTLREETSAVALHSGDDRCFGVITDRGLVEAPATILATGGAAALWRRTTNPWGAIGAGAVLAHAAGATLADLEFCQFHPTALYLPGSPHDGILVTEAIRGEGATLLDAERERFTDELAPRDAVTAAILDRTRADGTESVFLDLRKIEPAHFPNIFSGLAEAGFDARSQSIPVAPAAHYMIGGVAVDIDGRSSLPGLFAVGEASCNGLHGANRLASNSLSECFVFGTRAARAAVGTEAPAAAPALQPGWTFEPPEESTRDALWRLAGPSRHENRLRALLADPYPLARAIASAALAREESRGTHRREDFPAVDPELDGVRFALARDGTIKRHRGSASLLAHR